MRDYKEWLNNNELGISIWENKYRFENESFEDWLNRVTAGDEYIKQLIIDKKFLFAGRILANRGLDLEGKRVSINNCYVLESPKDDIESIYKTCSDIARTFSWGGGVGIDISNLRPKGALVTNSAKYSTGAVSFMDTFSQVAETIGQNGRRGALMLAMNVSHPDIEEFLEVKNDLTRVTKANISVMITDEFMNAVDTNSEYTLKFEVEATGEVITRTVNARELFMKICENAWNMGEPGILFWDTVERRHALQYDPEFKYECVNPCGEMPLPKGGACCLCAINLAEYVKDGVFCMDEFKSDIPHIVRAMNDVVDYSIDHQPLDYQKETISKWRQIGIGIMGLADMLIKMEIPYDSEDALAICEEIGFQLASSAYLASAMLAKEKGKTYPGYKPTEVLDSEYLRTRISYEAYEAIENYGLYNSQLLTIAPTGSISTMLGISGGVEPIFAFYYMRRTQSLHGEDVFYKVNTPIVEEFLSNHPEYDSDHLPRFFVNSQSINPMMRVKMQGIWQDHIDASISSTVNLPNEATVEQIYDIYMSAWKHGLKGLTVFRDGCARAGVLVTNTEEPDETPELGRGEWKSLAEDTYYVKRNLVIGCGKLKLFIGYSPSESSIQDLYIVKSGQGGCEKNLQAIAIAMSALLRVGGNLQQLEKAFSGIGACPSFVSSRAKGLPLSAGNYCGMAIINEVKAFLKEIDKTDTNNVPAPKKSTPKKNVPLDITQKLTNPKVKCPECGETLTAEGGCFNCHHCGYSKCN